MTKIVSRLPGYAFLNFTGLSGQAYRRLYGFENKRSPQFPPVLYLAAIETLHFCLGLVKPNSQFRPALSSLCMVQPCGRAETCRQAAIASSGPSALLCKGGPQREPLRNTGL